MTRCLALTHERHRCEQNAINGSGYCAEHAHFFPSPPRGGVGGEVGSPARGIARFLQRGDSNGVRDDTRLSVESSLKRKSTSELSRVLLDDQGTSQALLRRLAEALPNGGAPGHNRADQVPEEDNEPFPASFCELGCPGLAAELGERAARPASRSRRVDHCRRTRSCRIVCSIAGIRSSTMESA